MNQNFYNSNSPGFDQSQPSQFPVIHQDPQEISIQEMEDLKQQYLDEMKRLIKSKHRDEIKIDELKGNFNSMSIEIRKKEKLQQLEQSYLFESLLNRDESIPSGIDSDDSDSEEDNLFLERLLHDDPIPLPDTLDFSNVIRVFLPFFTYPVTSSILLSFGSEDTIFDPGIYHFSSLEPGVSHRSGTFMKFNESLMEILSSTCSPMDQ
nr:hypothetical protein [Tanacetum cinerariifolium]